MFVMDSTHNKTLADLDRAWSEVSRLIKAKNELTEKWDNLVDKINEKGGREFLDNALLGPPQQFNGKEIKQLLSLCHPDKHGGKDLAKNITQKLLLLRG